MKLLIPLLVSCGIATLAWGLANESPLLGAFLGVVGSIIGWYLGKRVWNWIEE